MIVCICHNVSEHKIRQAVDAEITSMPLLRDQLRIGTCCGKCHPHAKRVLRECLSEVARKLSDQLKPVVAQSNALAS